MAGVAALARLAAALISMAAGTLNCPTGKGWQAWNDNCYFWDASLSDTWDKALKFCRAYQGTELLYLESVDEKIWLSTVLDGIYWIGLNDRTQESDFQWTINKPLIPDIKLLLRDDIVNGSLKDCVELNIASGLLKDSLCSKKNKFICKSKKMMDWFEEQKGKGIAGNPPYTYPSEVSLALAKSKCLIEGFACVAILETSDKNNFYLLSSSVKFISKPQSTIYLKTFCSSGSVGPLCNPSDIPIPTCDCTGFTGTSLTTVCGAPVRLCQIACENRNDGTDCSKCLPECPDEPSEALREEDVSLVRLVKARFFGGSMLLTNIDVIYLKNFIMFYNDV